MIHYGGDYNPEQWDEAIWVEDIARMRDASVTMVSLGIFAWARIQPDEHTFDFDWLDRIITMLHDAGIGVDLATATASPPAWAAVAYPEMRPQNADGVVTWHGGRQNYAPTSPDYRRLAAAMTEAMANRYAQHPAVVLWHVNNEYGCHTNLDYSDNAARAFRIWLEEKYGTIDRLNEAWGTTFWSQTYGNFSQIEPPRATPHRVNPSSMLDFRRFSSDALLSLYTMERDIIRASGATQPITTNFMGMFPMADYWKWAQEVDIVSDDSYPDPNDPESFRDAALTRDLMRSLKPATPWLLMEQAPNAISWTGSNPSKAPGQMAALSAQALGRGADGILFFQWRQSRQGSEKFMTGMLPHSGTASRTWREIVSLGGDIARIGGLPAEQVAGDVAIVLDWESWWAISSPDHPVDLPFAQLLTRWYRALHRANVAIDFVPSTGDLSPYDVVVLPHAYLLSDAAAANLKSYVAGGGHLLATAFSGIVDENDALRDGGFTTALREVLGVDVLDFNPLVRPEDHGPGQRVTTVASAFGTFQGEYLSEELSVWDAEVVGTYSSGYRSGDAALTTRSIGSGRAHYLATVPNDDGMNAVAAWALGLAGVEALWPGLPADVEVARRGDILTFINHGDEPFLLPVKGTDIVLGTEVINPRLLTHEWLLLRSVTSTGTP